MSLSKKERFYSYLAVLPAIILFVMFIYYPLIKSLYYSFTDWNGYSTKYNFVGLDNFKSVGMDSVTIKTFANTIYFSVMSTLLGTMIQLVLAIMLNRSFKANKVYKVIYYIPVVVSFMIMSLTWRYILQYDGILNRILEMINLGHFARDWLGDSAYAMNMLVIINLLQSGGLGVVLFLAGLNNIPNDVYEAASVEGAKGLQLFRRITWPLLRPSVTITLFIGITGSLKVFDLPYILTNGGPQNSTKTVMMLIYEMAFKNERFGRSSAMSIIFFLVIASVSMVQLLYSKSKEVEH